MRPGETRKDALVAIACAVTPLLFAFWLRSAIVGLPLVAFFPAIAIATVFAGQMAGAFVLTVSVAAAVIAMRAPPLDFTLGLSLNGLVFTVGYAVSGVIVYLAAARLLSRKARAARQAQNVLAFSTALSRWLGSNARAAASLLRALANEADQGPIIDVARERLLMTARVERIMHGRVALEGHDLTVVLTDLCADMVRSERRQDLRGEIAIAPMELEHEDFIRLCLVFADLLFLAVREGPSPAQPLRVSLAHENGEAVLSVSWLRSAAPSWAAGAHYLMTDRVAGRLARSLGGALQFGPAVAGPASAVLRFPARGGAGVGNRRLRRAAK